MEHLYAPWRMEYIGAPQPAGCFFCRARDADPADDRANLLLWRGDEAMVILNRFPYNSGHLMVAPCAHVASLEDLTDGLALGVHHTLTLALRVLREVLTPEGFNIGANLGRIAGAGVPDHVHLHVVPRWGGDTNFMPILAETKVVNEHLERTWEKLHRAFSAATT